MQAFMVFVFRPPEANFQPTQKRTTTFDVFVQQMEIFSWISKQKTRDAWKKVKFSEYFKVNAMQTLG